MINATYLLSYSLSVLTLLFIGNIGKYFPTDVFRSEIVTLRVKGVAQNLQLAIAQKVRE